MLLVPIWAAPLNAQEKADEAAWQEVVDAQIQAFRDHDAPTAFNYASSAFKVSFQNAEVFFEAIMGAGYAPIVDSDSHTFGAYRVVGELGVLQQVKFIGNDQQFYEAIYQLTEEDAGWRVQGVQLFRQEGVAV
jgi:hypothetical protein